MLFAELLCYFLSPLPKILRDYNRLQFDYLTSSFTEEWPPQKGQTSIFRENSRLEFSVYDWKSCALCIFRYWKWKGSFLGIDRFSVWIRAGSINGRIIKLGLVKLNEFQIKMSIYLAILLIACYWMHFA